MVLHLVTAILFQQNTNCAIHISGKMVPRIISFLGAHIQIEHHAKLLLFEQLVIQQRKLAIQADKESQSEESSMAETASGDDQSVATGDNTCEEAPTSLPSGATARISDLLKVEEELQSLLDDIKKLVVSPKKSSE